MVISDGNDIRVVTLPFIFAWFGFLFFGLPGSIIWTCIYKLMYLIRWGNPQKHLASAILSALICTPLLTLFSEGLRGSEIFESYIMLLLVFPVALASALTHWYIYLRSK